MEPNSEFYAIRVNPNSIEELKEYIRPNVTIWKTPRNRTHLVKDDYIIFTNIIIPTPNARSDGRLYMPGIAIAVYHHSLFTSTFENRRSRNGLISPLIVKD